MNIIEMAREAGIHVYPEFENAFERFAALVEAAARADERETCEKLCMAVPRTGAYFARLIRARGTT